MVLNIENLLKLTQEELLDYCYEELQKRKYENKEIIYTENYIYAKGTIPILLVAHTDIVHKEPPEIIVNDKKQKILWSPTGIGGDDRCGVFAILKICEKFKPYVLFTTNEERGGVGVREFAKEIKSLPIQFIIEIDRRGNNQVVYYECDNKEFQEYIESFGFDRRTGSYSDVSTLSVEYDIAGCNLSAGYYNEHTTTEHIYLEHLYNTINKIKEILKDTEHHKYFDCQKKVYEKIDWSKYRDVYDDYFGIYDGDYYMDRNGYYRKRKKRKLKLNKRQKKQKLLSYKRNTIDDNDYFEKILLKEEDYYTLTSKQWKEKYKQNKPADILEIY